MQKKKKYTPCSISATSSLKTAFCIYTLYELKLKFRFICIRKKIFYTPNNLKTSYLCLFIKRINAILINILFGKNKVKKLCSLVDIYRVKVCSPNFLNIIIE